MNYKQIVKNQVTYIETDIIPYTLGFQEESRNRLDIYYGSGEWRKRIQPFIKPVWIMDCQCKESIDEMRTRDIYGSIWVEDNLMAHLEKPILSEPSLSKYTLPSVDKFFINNEFETAARHLKILKNSFTIIHIPWGIFEKSWSLRGFENALIDMSVNQKFYNELSDNIANHIMEFVEIAIKLPVDGIMFGDDWGGQTGLFMGKERWRKYFKNKYRMLYDRVHQSGKFVLNHCCGNIVEILPDLIDIGLDVYESFQPEAMDIYGVKREFGADLTFWGGLGAQSTIPFGTPGDIYNEVKKLRCELAKGGGFILAPSKDPPPETPLENLIALIDSFTEVRYETSL